jgi:hypothetical protein
LVFVASLIFFLRNNCLEYNHKEKPEPGCEGWINKSEQRGNLTTLCST